MASEDYISDGKHPDLLMGPPSGTVDALKFNYRSETTELPHFYACHMLENMRPDYESVVYGDVSVYNDLPEDLRADIDNDCKDSVDTFVVELLARLDARPAIPPGVVLVALKKAVKAALKANAPKANLDTEDDLDKLQRRESIVKGAVEAACEVLEEGVDGSWQEYEHLVIEIATVFLRKASMNSQKHLLQSDIHKRLESMTRAETTAKLNSAYGRL